MNARFLKTEVSPEIMISLHGKNSESSFWISQTTNSGTVEGKIFFPDKESDKLVIFEPGFPGGGSTQFEAIWLSKLLDKGYAVFLVRHNGTLIQGKYSANYLNSPERQELDKERGFGVIGSKKDNTLKDWLNEPLVALEIFTPHLSNVILCGHSFGPLALFHSLIEFAKKEPELTKKISRVVSLSGSIGKIRSKIDPILTIWFDHLKTEWARERVEIGDAQISTDIFEAAHIKINKEARIIPKHIEFLAVSSWGDSLDSTDEIVSPIESIDFINSLGRGYLILDKRERGDKKLGRMAHDMEALTSQEILNFVSDSWLPASQISEIV